jgi:hypothetical protein
LARPDVRRSDAFDRRLTPVRSDLAADHLRGLIDAPRYAKGQAKRIIAASAPLRRFADPAAPLETEAFHGETRVILSVSRQDNHGFIPVSRTLQWEWVRGKARDLSPHAVQRIAVL